MAVIWAAKAIPFIHWTGTTAEIDEIVSIMNEIADVPWVGNIGNGGELILTQPAWGTTYTIAPDTYFGPTTGDQIDSATMASRFIQIT